MQKIVVIVGPTASGKSALAVGLAQKINGEIISADSRQVYKGLNIGTGKITKREMNGVRHHLLDVTPPQRTFTAHDFTIYSKKAIADITKRGKVPIIAGGTGFYIDALVGRITLPKVSADKKLRSHLEKKTTKQLLALLKKRAPKRAKAIIERNEVNNKHRLVRALEISYANSESTIPRIGLSKSVSYMIHSPAIPYMVSLNYDVLWLGIKPDMKKLKKKIRERLTERMKKGMVAEARRLHKNGLSYKRMTELGLEYRYVALYLQEKITKEEMVDQLSAKIWQYAKRQMTYWKRNKDINWHPLSDIQKKKVAIVRDFLSTTT